MIVDGQMILKPGNAIDFGSEPLRVITLSDKTKCQLYFEFIGIGGVLIQVIEPKKKKAKKK